MAHTYTLDNVTLAGDKVSVIGSVDGVQVNVQVYYPYLQSLGSVDNGKAYIAAQMLATLPAAPVELTDYEGTLEI